MSKTESVTIYGEFKDVVLDEETGAVISEETVDWVSKSKEIDESVILGTITVLEIDRDGIDFEYELFDQEGRKVRGLTKGTLLRGNQFDLDKDGDMDLDYSEYDPYNAVGMQGKYILRFLNSEDDNYQTMYKVPQNPDHEFPNGIITVNPSNSLIVKLSNLDFDSTTDTTIILGNDGLPNLTLYDYIYDDIENVMYVITEEPVVEALTTTYTVATYGVYDAYEVVDVNVKDSLSRLVERGMTRGTMHIPLLNYHETTNLWTGTDPDKSYLRLKQDLDLDLILSANLKVNWDGVKADAGVKLTGDLSIILQGALDEYSHQPLFEHHLGAINQVIMVGPVPVQIHAPLDLGVDFILEGHGSLEVGARLTGAIGYEAEAHAGIKYKKIRINLGFWKKTIKLPVGLSAGASSRKIQEFTYEQIGPTMSFSGSATIMPYVKFSPAIKVAALVGVRCPILVGFPATVSTELYYDSNKQMVDLEFTLDALITANAELEVGLKIWKFDLTKSWDLGTIFKIRHNFYTASYHYESPNPPSR
jgi:hypothetical protein